MLLRILLLAGCCCAALAAAGAAAQSNHRATPKVSLEGPGGAMAAIDGNTILLKERGEAIYYSSKLATFLTRAERSDAFRRLIGREVVSEGAFLAESEADGGVTQRSGIAAVTAKSEAGVALALIRTFDGEDRIVDLFARPREMMAIAVVGFGEHVSCQATAWVSSKQANFSKSDFEHTRCEIRQGRVFGF